MKRRIFALVLLLALLAAALPSLAETYYVYTANGKTLNLRDEYTNQVIGHIPYGTALEPDPNKSTEIAAYVTYKGVSGFAKWSFLQKEKPKAKPKATPAPKATGVPYQPVSAQGVLYQGGPDEGSGYEITAAGGYIQRANSRNKAEGSRWETLRVSPEDNVIITADVPRGQKIDYWVINGVRYEFSSKVKSIRLTKADQDFSFEIVYTRGDSETLISPDAIQAARTGETLIVDTVKAQLCHINRKNKGAGGWMTSFNFTNDYTNLATGDRELGGQVTVRVKAKVNKNQKVIGWKFNEAELYPSVTVGSFIVRTLNTSMTYEPILKKVKAKATTPPADNPAPAAKYRVYCEGCTFSGGGYSNATSGTVEAGTQITVKSKFGYATRWIVNGSVVAEQYLNISAPSSIKRTINTHTKIVCIAEVN